jgi:FMN phosphatase YigB (HAD superfamily)
MTTTIDTMAARPRIVFFDIGQTLAVSAELSPRRLLGSRLGLTEKETKRVGRLIMTHPATTPEALIPPLKQILPNHSEPFLRSTLEDLWKEQQHCVQPIEGALPVLQTLKGLGHLLGVVSTTWHPLFSGFVAHGRELTQLMHYWFLSYREGYKKPSPELFQRALQATGRPACSCWMVGDSYELDIAPAMAAGMRTVWVLHTPEKERGCLARLLRGELPRPTCTIAHLAELPEALADRLIESEISETRELAANPLKKREA